MSDDDKGTTNSSVGSSSGPKLLADADADNVVRVNFGAKRSTEHQTRREIPIPKSSSSPKDPLAQQKLEAFAKLIELGMTMVTVDARRPGVVVPPVHQGEIQLNLNFSYRFGLDDFRFDDDDVRGSLSFGGTPHLCVLPWSAVYMIRSHITDDVAVFPSDLPPELAAAAAAELERMHEDDVDDDKDDSKKDDMDDGDETADASSGAIVALPSLERVPKERPDEASDDVDDDKGDDEPPRPGLRLVTDS